MQRVRLDDAHASDASYIAHQIRRLGCTREQVQRHVLALEQLEHKRRQRPNDKRRQRDEEE
jgi:hypothetical protein